MRPLWKAATVAASLVLFGATAAAAPAPVAIGIGVTPARLEWKLPVGTREVHSDVLVFNRSSGPVDVQVSLSDVAINHSGAWQLLAAGSTPYSFPATFTPDHFMLAKNGSLKVAVTASVASLRPLFGGALIQPVATASTGVASGGIGYHVNTNLLVPLVAAPVGSSGVVEGVELSGRAAGLTVASLVEHGPIAATVAARNTSSFYERAFTTVEYSAWGHTYLTLDLPPVGTFPGTVAQSTATSVVQAPGAGTIDPSPWIGLVHVTATTHLVLLDSSASAIVQDRWVVIFPWRLGLGLLALLCGWQLIRRVRRST